MSKISVVMPAYNSSGYIRKSINSILSQKYYNLELIIINDGSKDDTEEIILEMKAKDKRIKYIKIENSGSAVARNVGLQHISGEFIAFIDSDDFINKDMFFEMMLKTEKYNCDIVGCSFKKIYPTHKVSEETFMPGGLYDKNKLEDLFYPTIIADKSLSKTKLPKTLVTKIYKRTLIDDNNIRFIPGLRMGQDIEFSRKCLLHAESFYYMPERKFYNYVHNSTSRTQTYLENAWVILNEHLEQLLNLSKNFTQYKLNDQIPYAIVANAMTAIANVGMKPQGKNRTDKIDEIKNIVLDKKVQYAIKTITYKELPVNRKILAILIQYKQIFLIYIATFFYKRK